MPQIRLEYSSNCRPENGFSMLFDEIHHVVNRVGGIHLENCKSRAIVVDDFHIGDGDPSHAFAHLSVRFIEGRDKSTRQEIGKQCLQSLQNFFRDAMESHNLQLTVEVQDIRLEDYHKYPPGSLTPQ